MRLETRAALKIKFTSAIIRSSSFVHCPVFKIKITIKHCRSYYLPSSGKVLRETLSFTGWAMLL
jgi:hypothetical protein